MSEPKFKVVKFSPNVGTATSFPKTLEEGLLQTQKSILATQLLEDDKIIVEKWRIEKPGKIEFSYSLPDKDEVMGEEDFEIYIATQTANILS